MEKKTTNKKLQTHNQPTLTATPPQNKKPYNNKRGEPTKNFLFSHVIYFMQGLSAG